MKTAIRTRILSFTIVAAALLAMRPHTAAAAPGEPFLFSYVFNNHLKIAGGYFTMNGGVQLVVRLNNGKTVFVRNVTARPHSVTPGGAIYVDTPIAAPCAPGNNGYARAFDRTTQRWSPRLPIAICQRID